VVWAPLWLPVWLPLWPLDCPAELELPVEPDDDGGVPCAAIHAVQARKVMVSKIVFDIGTLLFFFFVLIFNDDVDRGIWQELSGGSWN
jgi:hypothetical protein